MEPTSAENFIDQQLSFNKDIVKASQSTLDGLTRQAKLNNALAEQLRDQENTLKTHRSMITALTVGLIGTTLGIILLTASAAF
jgi:hypothetical protein